MKKVVVILLLLVSVSSCKKPEDANKLFNSFDRKGMLTNQANTVIIPAFLAFVDESKVLKNNVSAFNISDLNLYKQQWINTALKLKLIELYKFGPIDDNLLYGSIDFWPARSADIENFITANTTFNDALIEASGSTVKGLPAIEYLLFNSNAVASFSTATDAAKRIQYLQALCNNLNKKAKFIKDDWTNTYATTFISKDAQALDGSINVSINRLVELLEYIKNNKIGKPFGKKDGTKYPDQVEAFYSGQSTAYIKANLQAMKLFFSGGTALGYDDFLDHVNAKTDSGDKLSVKILSQFDVCIAACDAVSVPLSDAVNTQTPQVDDLYLALKQLNVLLKVDAVNNLGITLTFTDNDGD